MKSMFGEDSAEYKDIEKTFDNLDLDGSNGVDYTEFCAAGMGQKLSSQDDVMYAAFKTFDVDKSGFISKRDLGKILDISDVHDAWSARVLVDVTKEIVKDM